MYLYIIMIHMHNYDIYIWHIYIYMAALAVISLCAFLWTIFRREIFHVSFSSNHEMQQKHFRIRFLEYRIVF